LSPGASGALSFLVQQASDVRFWQILLQKSFWGDERQFSGTLTRVARGDVRTTSFLGKTTTDLRSGVMALRNVTAL